MALLPAALLPSHSKTVFVNLRGVTPNRVCFATVHATALRANAGSGAALKPFKFSLPFRQGVLREFVMGTGIKLQESKYGYWSLLTEDQANIVRAWMGAQGTRVYMKDLFDCSVALGERTTGGRETELGQLFNLAKYREDRKAATTLVQSVATMIGDMRTLQGAECISCPPPRANKDFDLPTFLAKAVAKSVGAKFLELGCWDGEKGQMKSVAVQEKWDELDRVGFTINSDLTRVKGSIILLDDIYQSGTTLNFLRARLTKAGIAGVSAVSLVKAARDTDNQ